MSAWEMILTDSESDVVSATQAPVQPNFEEIFATHHRIIYRYACALTRDGALAEDIVQEVFIRLYKNPDAARNEELLRAWLLRVTANVAQNMLRGRRRATTRDETFVILAAQTAENPQPDEALLREAEISSARQALNQIREPIRSCLLLKHEGLSHREIAKALGIKEASVGSMIARGRREFIRLYEKIAR
jgi:RNA polymerase sigma factor (sigma-70 family)